MKNLRACGKVKLSFIEKSNSDSNIQKNYVFLRVIIQH